MKLEYSPFELELKYPFTISGFSRTSTPVMLVKLQSDGYTGNGEASMVPYMGENLETATTFLKKADLSRVKYPFDYDEILSYLDSLSTGDLNIKAAIDIALHDLQGKIEGRPCFEIFNADPKDMPATAITIGIDTPDIVIKKVKEADVAHVLKVKLGSNNDKELINTIRLVSDKPLYVDANQGWKDREQALDLVYWLHEQDVQLIEQPMAKSDLDGNAWITERSPIPIIADESVQRLKDVEQLKGAYHGINMKLMKCGGMHEGHQMIVKARALGMKILVGCMSETSCATLAGAALAPLCDWADLDGPFLTKNNPYKTPEFKDGKWILSDLPGLGLS